MRSLFIRRFLSLVLTGIAGIMAVPAGADVKWGDLPPPPGALEHELSSGTQAPVDGAAPAPAGKATVLSQPIEIPFIYEGGHIIIEASIAGQATRPFLFDTGARHVIAPDMAQTLKGPAVKTTRVGGIGPKISQAEMINGGSITVGGASLAQQMVSVVDIPNVVVDRGSRPRLAGLIGSELLSHYVVTIDYMRHMLTLNSPGFRPRSAQFSLPLRLAISPEGVSHPAIPAELNGIAGDFLLDTGASGQVAVSENFQQEHQTFGGTILHFLSPGGIGGPANIRMGFAKQLRIGPSVFASPLITGIDRGNSAPGSLSSIAGIIGNGILSHFTITIDVAGGHAYFEPVPDRLRASILFGSGLIVTKPEHDLFLVLDVIKGTAAERAGLQRGDRIVEIAGQPARDLGIADVHNFAPSARSALTIVTSDRRHLESRL